jgi:hypothetical protein
MRRLGITKLLPPLLSGAILEIIKELGIQQTQSGGLFFCCGIGELNIYALIVQWQRAVKN